MSWDGSAWRTLVGIRRVRNKGNAIAVSALDMVNCTPSGGFGWRHSLTSWARLHIEVTMHRIDLGLIIVYIVGCTAMGAWLNAQCSEGAHSGYFLGESKYPRVGG